jgi:hypothetical protein
LPSVSALSEKYYVNGKVKEGMAGAYYPSKDVTYKVYFDKEKLPYLGLWVTQGEYGGDYNCALEPTNGFYDSVEAAQRDGDIFILKKEEKLNFSIKMELK